MNLQSKYKLDLREFGKKYGFVSTLACAVFIFMLFWLYSLGSMADVSGDAAEALIPINFMVNIVKQTVKGNA